MGQIPQCSFCIKEREKEENLITSKATDFFISQTNNKNVSLIDLPILKSQKSNSLFNLPYQECDSYIVQEGFGLIYFKNNSIFKGLFHNGKPNGWGIYLNPINGTYQGEYKNDKPNGYCIYEHITESIYEGYWTNEKQEGIGIEKWVDGAIYKGQFANGKKCGIGIYIFPNNNIYLGEWSENFMNGWGIYNYGKNNNIYMGEWKNGLRNGYGEIYEPDNNYYFGYFRNNLQNGFFISYNLKNNKIIIGYNINGKVEGIVKYFRKDKEGKLIIVKNGKKIKEIEDQDKILSYLIDKNNYGDKKNNKIIIGYNINGKVEGIVKYFRKDKEGKLIIVKNGKKIKEIEDEDKILNYLIDKNNYGDKKNDNNFNKYFYMKRKELENILINKVNNIEINEINNQITEIKKENI